MVKKLFFLRVKKIRARESPDRDSFYPLRMHYHVQGPKGSSQEVQLNNRPQKAGANVIRLGNYFGIVKQNLLPPKSESSTHILPLSASIIFLQIAKPIPVPSNSCRLCSR